MKFKIEKNLFLNCIQKVQLIVERKNAVPILGNVKITTDTDKIEINATDMNVALKDIAEAEVLEPGSITVSAKKLYEVLKELPDDIVVFTVQDNNWISIECAHSVFKLVGMSDEDFPLFPEFDAENLIQVPSDFLDMLTKKTIYAVSNDENRHVINGVLFIVEDKSAKMIATDGHRLAYIETKIDMDISEFKVIIPKKGIQEIQRMIGSGAEQLEFGIVGNQIAFRVGNELVLSRLVEGDFPDYTKVLPKVVMYEIKLGIEELMNSLRRVSIFSDHKVRGVKLEFSENQLRISASTPEYGEAADEIDIAYDNDPFSVGFNVNYLLDLLRVMDCEEVMIKVESPGGPTLFEPVTEPDSASDYNYLAIVMPMLI